MSWLGAAVAVATLAAIFVVLARALRKAQHYEGWGVGKATQQWYGGPFPGQLGPPIEVVTGPEEVVTELEEDERPVATTGGANRPAD